LYHFTLARAPVLYFYHLPLKLLALFSAWKKRAGCGRTLPWLNSDKTKNGHPATQAGMTV
jgi:hypothetical protein